ncbi:hypothetical protein IMSAG049_00541 [Clostridiales bacterium]|nr:hypothetical protein IMSAG049_00541 [Clostridiales bacterium]
MAVPSVIRSVLPDTATAPPVYLAMAAAADLADSTESVASTPRTLELSEPPSSPQRPARAIISEAFPLIILGLNSLNWLSRLVLNSPIPMATGSKTQGFPSL